jgi:hypothetical protein
MINLNDINWNNPGVKQSRMDSGTLGEALAMIINSKVVSVLCIDKDFSDILCSATSFEEIDYNDNSFYVKVITLNEEYLFKCDEMTQAILLSNCDLKPILEIHKYKEMVSVGWSYLNEEFVIPGEME